MVQQISAKNETSSQSPTLLNKGAPPTIERTASPTPAATQELDRVREIILGPDHVHQRLQGAEVDRLRQVIFGAQMEEYDRRFSDLRREMERMLTDLRLAQDTISEFEKTQTKRVENIEREMRRANDELRRELDRLSARESMVQQLLTRAQQQELSSRGLSEQINELRNMHTQHEREVNSFKATVTEHREQQERKVDALKHEVRQAEDDLRAELRRVTDRLGDQKTDRKALAAMLMEVATRLETGRSVTGLLEELTIAAPE